MWETPRASFIPAQGNALGSSAPKPISAESAIHPSSYQPPASHSASVPNVSFIELYEAGLWPATEYLLDDEPRALPWAGMKQAFGLSRGHPPGEHPSHRNPFFIREIREIRGSSCCNPWFQLLFLGLIPMKSQASTNSVLRSCPQGRAEVQGGRRDRWETRQVGATGGRRQGRHSYQPRATPWVHQPQNPSALKVRFILRPSSRQPEA